MARSSSPLVRRMARRGTRLLPHALRAWIARYRFGHTGGGRHFSFEETAGADGPVVRIDDDLVLAATPEFLEDLRFHFVAKGESREEMAAFTRALARLPADALLVDVGAHRGLFALVHCASAPGRRALLFEASPSLAAEARALLARNGFASRAVVRTAWMGERAERTFVVEDALHFAQAAAPGTPGASEVVVTTLDDEWRNGARPAIVKIDVEGAEAEVLRGGLEMLRQARPVVFLELHLDVLERRGEPIAAVLDLLASYGYRVFSMAGRPLPRRWLASSLRAIVRIEARPA